MTSIDLNTLFEHFTGLVGIDITDTDSDEYKINKQAFLAGAGAVAACTYSMLTDDMSYPDMIVAMHNVQVNCIKLNPQ
jgi:hypothetical protein